MMSFNAYELTALELALRIAKKHIKTSDGKLYMERLHYRVARQVRVNFEYDGRWHEPLELVDELK